MHGETLKFWAFIYVSRFTLTNMM